MNKTSTRKKILLTFSLILIIFTIAIVPKDFQNDTFFNIAIGKHILDNGIDMQEHWAFSDGLTYTYSHWAFDIITYLLYNTWNFTGIYIFVILFSIFTVLTLFYCLYKKNDSPITSFIITILTAYMARNAFAARSQIISFVCFIAEIYCIEKLMETNKKRYGLVLIILSIIIANFHAATWSLYLVLFLPYFACEFLNFISFKEKYSRRQKKLEKKLNKIDKKSKTYEDIISKLEICKKNLSEDHSQQYTAFIKKDHYNIKALLIVFIIVIISGLITPIQDTPYTYIINSMLGKSNFDNGLASVDYISEMQPTIPASTEAFVIFTILFIAFVSFMPCKLKVEHAFLILGLYIMAFSSVRYVYLLAFLGSYVLNDLIVQCVNIFVADEVIPAQNLIAKPLTIAIMLFAISSYTISHLIENSNVDYVTEALYPTKAVEYIKSNLDYKNIKIYNSYNNGSYLMLHDIPVFIDSRLDVYCSEFNDTDIFRDFIYSSTGHSHYEEIFSKYDFSHILLYKDEIINQYIVKDSNYKLLYEDDNFALYERNVK